MADAYREWLQERVDWYTDWCLKDVEAMGRPGQVRFANQSMRYTLEAFEECLSEYDRLTAASPTRSPDPEP